MSKSQRKESKLLIVSKVVKLIYVPIFPHADRFDAQAPISYCWNSESPCDEIYNLCNRRPAVSLISPLSTP